MISILVKNVLVILLLLSITLSSCHTPQRVVVANRSHSDTLAVARTQYDSVYVGTITHVDRRSDTVFVERLQTEFRYRLRHDTLREIRIDTVPVIHEVEVIRDVKHIPWYARGMLWLLLFCALALTFCYLKRQK